MLSYDDHLKHLENLRKSAEASDKAEEANYIKSNEDIADDYISGWLEDPANEMQKAISYTKEDLVQILADFKTTEVDLEYNQNRNIKDAKSKLKDLLNLIELSEPEKTFHIESLKIIISKL